MTDARTRALHSLVRLRKTEVDHARSAMARAMAEEHAAGALVESRLALIDSEQREASLGHASLDDFRAWLPAGVDAVERARAALDVARQASDQARGMLMQANAALKAAEAILDKRLEEEREARARREQAELDDLSRRNRAFST